MGVAWELDSSDSGQGPGEGLCERDNLLRFEALMAVKMLVTVF
jgi:hypothetical protein